MQVLPSSAVQFAVYDHACDVLRNLRPPGARNSNAARLLETTYWEAPSDVLLPARERDIYRDLPALEVSTEGNEGALL